MGSSNEILNSVLITMARSFMQYVAEGFPWVSREDSDVGSQVEVIAQRQRQDVADITDLLIQREHFVDFGTFPTEYTDMQFLALGSLFDGLHASQAAVCKSIADGLTALQASGDEEAIQALQAINVRQKEAAHALTELSGELVSKGSA